VFIGGCLSNKPVAPKPPRIYDYHTFFDVLESMIEAGVYRQFIAHIETDQGYNTIITRQNIFKLVSGIVNSPIECDINEFIGYLCFYELCERYYKDNNL
jgi:hypothetical protein